MPRVLALAMIGMLACGPTIPHEKPTADVTKHLPGTLETSRPKTGDAKTVKVRIYVDAGARAQAKWREEIGDQLDYASQLLVPMAGMRLSVESIKEWNRNTDPYAALPALVELDKGTDVTWVIGYITPGDKASKAMSELGAADPLGHHVIVRSWAEKPESEALATALPDLKEAERGEVMAAHRRHKQTVVLLHMLAATLGAIDEADPSWIQSPTYSTKQNTFSDRNRELITLGLEERVLGTTDQNLAKKLLEAIEKTGFGGWVPTSHDEVTKRMRNVIDASRAGRIAAAVPPAAYDQYTRIRELAKQGKAADALAELDNLILAYPGNAAMTQLKCEIMVVKPGVGDKATRTACTRASELAPGDPAPHMTVGEALLRASDTKAARSEFQLAEGKIGNLPSGVDEAWRKLIELYKSMGSLTWTEEAIVRAKLEKDPIAVQVTQTRSRYGVPRGAKFVAVDQESVLVQAIRATLDLVYASKYREAEKAIAAAEKKWPGSAGLTHARCDLALRQGQVDAARGYCNKALAIDPNDSWALYLSAVIALKTAAGNAQGIEQLKKAIAVDPELGQAWRTLAKAYIRTKDRAALEKLAEEYQAKFGQALPN
ncbi:MAG: tetratricopeptide repeat protein [Kofleriaceae bacterium]